MREDVFIFFFLYLFFLVLTHKTAGLSPQDVPGYPTEDHLSPL